MINTKFEPGVRIWLNIKPVLLSLLLTFLLIYSHQSAAQSSEIATLKTRLIPDFISDEQQRAEEDSTTISVLAADYYNSQQSNGSWSDIDYTDISRSEWAPSEHLARLRTMAADYYQTPTSAKLSQLSDGIDYWYQVNPVSDNWWWGDIGKQKYLGPIGLILESQLQPYQKANILSDFPTTPSMTGANRTDISQSVIYGGLLDNDGNRVQAGIDGIGDSIVQTTAEGIQPDNSYHQHGPLLHNGSYGKVLLGSSLYWAYQVRDLQWAYPQSKVNIITDYFLDGDRWMTRHGRMDYSTGGRSISRPGPLMLSNDTLLKRIDYVEALVPARASETQAFRAHVNGGPSGLDQYKHYWRSDYSINARPEYLFSVHMSSNRVRSSETGNGENLLGFWLGLGNTFLYQSGQEYRDIFPVWDWTKLPGVTGPAYEGPSSSWGESPLHNSTFVGGVSSGDAGISVMKLDILATRANKAWFHFEDMIVALGSDINSTHVNDVFTTVEQNLLDGDVTVDGSALNIGTHNLTNAGWVHHKNVGYLFPNDWSGTVSLQSQNGSWKRINESKSDSLISKDVFKLAIAHGNQPASDDYAYIILPNVSVSETQNAAQSSGIDILVNNESLQAVYHQNTQTTGIVFYQPGSLILPGGETISVTHSSAVLIDQSLSTPSIMLATPGSGGMDVGICWTDNSGLTQKELVAMPGSTADLGRGQPVTFDGTTGECSATPAILPAHDAYTRDGSYADTNYGNRSYIAVKDSVSGFQRAGFLQWDLSQLANTSLQSANLRLHIRNSDAASIKLYASADNWEELSLTHNTAPNKGVLLAQPGISGNDQWLMLDLTSYINSELASDQTASIIIEGGDPESYTAIDSKEHSSSPQLLITPMALLPSEDAMVRDGSYANDNYGSWSYMATKPSSSGFNRKVLMQWDLSKLSTDNVSQAQLKLHVRNTDAATTLNLYKTGDGWNEQSLSWNTAPASGWLFAQPAVSGDNQWITVDITDFVNAELAGDKHLSFVIEGSDAEVYTAIDSKEDNNQPQIVIGL
ncbi:polysaccharide lyase family 8 super-sandwich domain-containing protein [Lacimicrobium sp. SS2-24]|uniref:polysaccharide lyase family 8 super-sandwich domain-containing protein n=1 Tax=Lacimicrobium sp. SS2-24 TaxID=2005569 RepID=UPI000B4C18B9|nr:polysaccharide lyase family 8 super-sandwich domain-containing protein [Lacimicrobium sp. SS2-24]